MWYKLEFKPNSWVINNYKGTSAVALPTQLDKKIVVFKTINNYLSWQEKLELLKEIKVPFFNFDNNPIAQLHNVFTIQGLYGYVITHTEITDNPFDADIILMYIDEIMNIEAKNHPLYEITLIKELRDTTLAGYANCKKALVKILTEDVEKILTLKELMEKAKAELDKNKKVISASSSTLKEGIVAADTSLDQKTGVILSLGCKTDFAAKTEQFNNLMDKIIIISLEKKPENITDLLSLDYNEDFTIFDAINDTATLLNEPVSLLSYRLFTVDIAIEDYSLYIYNHTVNNKLSSIGLFRKVKSDDESLIKEVLMHIAAANPLCKNKLELVDEIINLEKEIIQNELSIDANYEKKPKDIQQKIFEGKLDKFFKDAVLEEQPMSKFDNKKTVQQFLTEHKLILLEFDQFQI